MSSAEFTFPAIGLVHCREKYPSEMPRQGIMAENTGTIELFSGHNFEAALEDLDGFERIWVLFVFHRNDHWKPKILPPESPDNRKVGVFASRSPYRPNPIGLSAVRLLEVRKRSLLIANFDMLDGTPVLDVKPYIPAADAFPQSKAGWRDQLRQSNVIAEYSPKAQSQIEKLLSSGGPDLRNVISVQLLTRTPDPSKQRLQIIDGVHCVLSWRTWRIVFERRNSGVWIERIESAYSEEERHNGEDVYADKALHRALFG